MAEFKLGRIKFVWKDDWSTGITYLKDDVIRYGGKTYICVVGHISAADFNTDLNFVPSKWNLMTDGQAWRGSWTISTAYRIGDTVKYGGNVYLCNLGHTSASTASSGLENDSSKWDIFAEGFDWKGDWTVSTRYKLNDLVKYGGYTYVCNLGHTSAATVALGLENNIANWDVFNSGIEYKDTWITLTRYKLNDVVKYGGGLWICTTQHSAGATFAGDTANWSQFVEGLEFENTWSSGAAYQPGDVVRYGGNQYVAKTQHTNSNPLVGTANWDLFSEGLKYQSDWAITTSYKIGEVVKLNGYTYLATTDAPAITTTASATDVSTKYITVASTTGMVANMAVKFTGTTFGNVFTNGTYYVRQVIDGFNFTISNTPAGAIFTPTTAAGTMSVTAAAKPPNAAYWSQLTAGVNWRDLWSDDAEYVIGDTVRYGSNVYICVLAHRSEGDDVSTVGATGGGQANSRPDLDITNIYWNLFNVGSETSVLTTLGDMVYFGGAGPTRLPIGQEGQILRVSADSIPEWVSWGTADHAYYVSPTGEDIPAPIYGKTLDKPWKTIRYACEQVERGPRNPNAKRLLELNTPFIQREVTEWIDRQVTTNTAPFTTSFVYAQDRCERDVGLVIDALLYDIGHGGNVKSRGAALAYVNAITEDNPGVYVNLAAEADEDIAAYNYMLTVIESVLNNEAPAVNYQVLNGDNSTAVVPQYIDTNYTAEAGAMTAITELVTIITDALADQNADNIPARYAPNNLIQVRTGRYREVLPIIVPAETCVMGDELRSTNAGPAGSLVSRYDTKYSIGSLGRLETVAGQIVLGTNVTESPGNTSIQYNGWPLATAQQATSVQQLVRTMQHKIDYNLGTTVLFNYPNPTGYNSSYLIGYGDARTLLKENKEFMQAEIIAFITATYPGIKYSKTICKRDVGYVVDAMVYDLTYGGSTQTLNAGLAYFDGVGSTLMIDSTELTATIASYNRLKTVMQQIIINTTVTRSATNDAVQFTDSALTTGSSASSFIGANIDIITAILTGGATTFRPNLTVTSITSTNTLNTTGAHGLAAGDLIVPRVTAFGLTADIRYYVLASGLTGTAFQVSTSFGGTLVGSLTNGSGLSFIVDTEDRPIATDSVTTTTALITAYTTLSAAVGTIVTSMTSFITANYPTLSYNSAKCQRDARIILDAVGYDFMFNSNFQTIKAAYAYLRSSASDVFSLNQKAATRAAFSYVKTLAKSNVGGDATAQARIETLMTTLDDILFGATAEGSLSVDGFANIYYAVLQLERNRDYMVNEISAYIASTYTGTVTATTSGSNILTISDTSWLQRNTIISFSGAVFGNVDAGIQYYVQNVVSPTTFKIAAAANGTTPINLATVPSGSMTVSLFYDTAACERDVNAYIDAIKYDLKYPGNYKSLLAARYYSNAVAGSLEEDMYYLRNGTGLRNQTLADLSGDLLAPNAYGTSRVSAGAYASLDPGWGPADSSTWITSRSPYVQNVTTFGNAAIGQKVDGSLHNGGNKSITSNDFTQVISDGIGAWITNNARAELVSVFSYYSHIGYLAENGGRIRGTNGNNSYGDFGSVAEGFDSTETPNTAVVDNKQFRAEVGSVLTNSVDTVYQFEFNNAGTDYTAATWAISGAGINAATEQDEFRDGAVFQVRLLDNIDDSTDAPEADGNYGGIDYISNANTAQGGTATQITIAATDSEISAAYVGMKVYLTGGSGAGQFGIIATYNAGTKIATVTRETTGAAGWDHVVSGTTIVSPDASTTYIIEPRISFTSPSYSTNARTTASTLTWVDTKYAPITKLYTSVTGTTSGSGLSASFNVTRKNTKYSFVDIINAGTGYARLDTITLAGTNLGGASTTNDITITITSVNSITGAIQAFEFSGYAAGGNFVALATGTNTVDTSANGTTWTARTGVLAANTTWIAMAEGALTATETAGSFVTGRAYQILTLGNTLWTSIGASANIVGTRFIATGTGGATTGTAAPIANHLVAIASGGTTGTTYSVDGGVTWAAGGALPAGSYTAIAYGNGRWVAIATGSSVNAYSTNGGITWTAGGTGAALTSAAWTGIAYGGGKFVAVASGGTTSAYSTNGGVNWIAATGLASSNWQSISWGNNRFVAVSNTSGTAAAYSLNGITWTASTLPATAQWTRIAYGQGVFLAVSQSTQAASSEDGINWTSRTTSTAANGFSGVAHGNPNQSGIWVAVQRSTAGTVASSILVGATTRARAYVSNNKIFAIRLLEPGSGYTVAPTITITDPNNIYEAPTSVRIGNGALANPSFTNRGVGYLSASVELDTGDGYASNFQSGQFIAVKRLTSEPVSGSNVVFGHLPNQTFKLVNIVSLAGLYDGSYSAFFQVSPDVSLFDSPNDAVSVSTRIRYSQVRLTGHDFLDIGTGNLSETNYPNTPTQEPVQDNETVESNGGRVFFTSTDQDGNFRVGDLFTIEQSTGIATLNADAFNISGLQEITLGAVSLGGSSATISEFSTDPFFTANSDNIVPTQRAIKAYITSQIGGGGAALNVNSVTAGFIQISGSQITTTTGGTILMKATFNFTGGVRGLPTALSYFLT